MMLHTDRLLLRPWREADREPLARLFADPQVMRYFASPRDRAQSDAWMNRQASQFCRNHVAIYAVEAPGIAPLIGFVGLHDVPDNLPCAPATEFVWTLDKPFWRQGYATEAAKAVMRDGFDRLHLPEIVAFTAAVNTPSRAVMAGLGMTHDPADDFDHPALPQGHLLTRHVLYRLRRP